MYLASTDKKTWRRIIKLIINKDDQYMINIDPELPEQAKEWRRFFADAFATLPENTSLEEAYNMFKEDLDEDLERIRAAKATKNGP